jgi:type VI secretion system protein ImpK
LSERGEASALTADAEATVVLPTPGRRRQFALAPSLDRKASAADLNALGGLNDLIEAANPILAAVPQIRHALRHPDPAGLRTRLREQLEAFERSARAMRVSDEHLYVARYALCALLDDAAAATPWGRDWLAQGLVADLHGEAGGGGEKFFALLDQITANPSAYRDLVEFFFACLALGFEGRYRGGEGGRLALAQIRARLYELISAERARSDVELSGRWRGTGIVARRLPGGLVLWGLASVCALGLAALYFVYSVSLGALSDPVARELALLKPPAVAAAAARGPAAGANAAGTQLRQELAEAIAKGEIEVLQGAGGANVIVLKADQLFASGSAKLDAGFHPVIRRIAAALDRVPGVIVVTGHSDDTPIRSARFPSNWELSAERARSVGALLAAGLREPSRLRAEGVADSEPLAPNDSAANRARNRRVAIILGGAS